MKRSVLILAICCLGFISQPPKQLGLTWNFDSQPVSIWIKQPNTGWHLYVTVQGTNFIKIPYDTIAVFAKEPNTPRTAIVNNPFTSYQTLSNRKL